MSKNQNQSAQKKQVRFLPFVRQIEVQKLGTKSEKWYSQDDFASIRDSNKRIMSFVSSSETSPPSPSLVEEKMGDSIRGLEMAYPKQRLRRWKLQQRAIRIVLREQQHQRNRSVTNIDNALEYSTLGADKIALMYFNASKHAKYEAINNALRDEQDNLTKDLGGGDVHIRNRVDDMASVAVAETPNTRRKRLRKVVSAAA